VVVRFVDIGEIVDHRRLNFLFIIDVHVFSVGCRGRGHMVVGFTTTYAISA
jgi:hypothetical protein